MCWGRPSTGLDGGTRGIRGPGGVPGAPVPASVVLGVAPCPWLDLGMAMPQAASSVLVSPCFTGNLRGGDRSHPECRGDRLGPGVRSQPLCSQSQNQRGVCRAGSGHPSILQGPPVWCPDARLGGSEPTWAASELRGTDVEVKGHSRHRGAPAAQPRSAPRGAAAGGRRAGGWARWALSHCCRLRPHGAGGEAEGHRGGGGGGASAVGTCGHLTGKTTCAQRKDLTPGTSRPTCRS